MSADNKIIFPENAEVLSKKSWVAYFWLVLFFLFSITIVSALLSRVEHGFIITLVILLPIFTLRFLKIRSVKLYIDETGVWLHRGIFPWDKGSVGVKWRDLDEAVVYLGFRSWVFKSHSLRIGHRFTKSSELLLDDMTKAIASTTRINDFHQKLIAEGKLS